MKIRFIGVGSAFTTPDYYQSNLLITAPSGRKILVDCGTDIRFSLREGMPETAAPYEGIDAIYISHLHSDHIGGMEWLAFQTYFNPEQQRPRLYMEETIMREMWHTSLKGGLGCIEGKRMHLTDYFDCRPAAAAGSFVWESIRFTLVQMAHITTGYRDFYSYGLLISDVAERWPTVFFTTDTQYRPHLIREIGREAAIIFHDCETSPVRSIVHAHYRDLRELPAELRARMWLYHYQPQPTVDPKKDGFLGFVKKGQEFDLASANAGRIKRAAPVPGSVSGRRS
jgi:ribonuclease BN (tRNA processing enzyme)